jgi:two-component system LytT family response regulator
MNTSFKFANRHRPIKKNLPFWQSNHAQITKTCNSFGSSLQDFLDAKPFATPLVIPTDNASNLNSTFTMVTAVIIDDEFMACTTLKIIIENHCHDVKVVGMASEYVEALRLIEHTRPNLAFLDIQMPGGGGFELAAHWPSKESKFVFVSGQLHLVAETYTYDPLYFLSKPIRISEVQKAIAKYHEAVAIEALKLSPLPPNPEPPVTKPDWAEQLVVPDGKGFRIFPYDEILYIEGERSYCKVHLKSGTSVTVSKLVKDIEALLPSPRFLRVHRSYIVHMPYVTKVSGSDRLPILLRDGTEIPVSKEYIASIWQTFLGHREEVE